MSIKEEMLPYLTTGGYACNEPLPPGTIRGCDNQPLFTSAYHIMLWRNGEYTLEDLRTYWTLISACVGVDRELHRAPGDTAADATDDHYGVLAGFAEFKMVPSFKLPIRLWVQPQFVYAYFLAKRVPSLAMVPLMLYTALVLAVSCIGAPASDSGSRQLNWMLWQAVKRKSWLCNLAGKFWHWRQTKVYGTQEVMKAVAAIYYLPTNNNPYAKYWID